jgi:hypothetical protein
MAMTDQEKQDLFNKIRLDTIKGSSTTTSAGRTAPGAG